MRGETTIYKFDFESVVCFRYGKEKMSDLDAVKQDVAHLWKNHERNAAAVKEIRATLEKMLGLANNQDDQSGFGGSSFA